MRFGSLEGREAAANRDQHLVPPCQWVLGGAVPGSFYATPPSDHEAMFPVLSSGDLVELTPRCAQTRTPLATCFGQAEKIAAKMLAEQRVEGYIDQKNGTIHFSMGDGNLQQWDRHIRNVCNQVNSVLAKIKDQTAMRDA